MIQANELRINNYVLRKGFLFEDNNFYETKVTHNDIRACIVNKNHFKPIPLTEDWLLKFGFTKKDHTCSDKSISENLFFKENYFVEFSEEGILFCQLHYFGQGWFLKIIEYVHQLQNIYFALTGQELSLKDS